MNYVEDVEEELVEGLEKVESVSRIFITICRTIIYLLFVATSYIVLLET